MGIATIPANEKAALPPPIPPLENGDRLSREEFERRYEAMPLLKKAELIEGVVHVSSLAAEIAATSASYHLGPKLQVYRRNGVCEYVVWRVLDQAIDWFILRGSQYERLPAGDGIYKSEVFPGLWLDSGALLAGDGPRVHDVLTQGLASREQQEFVAKLRN